MPKYGLENIRNIVLLSHGGAGSILNAMQAGKPLVVVPRLKSFGEVIDDHQLELAEALSQQGRGIAVTDPSGEALWQAIVRIEQTTVPATQLTNQASANPRLQDALRVWLAEQSTSPSPSPWRLLHRRH